MDQLDESEIRLKAARIQYAHFILFLFSVLT